MKTSQSIILPTYKIGQCIVINFTNMFSSREKCYLFLETIYMRHTTNFVRYEYEALNFSEVVMSAGHLD